MSYKKYNFYKKKKKHSKSIIAVVIIFFFLIFSILIINIFSSGSRDTIIGKWQSESTGDSVNFTADGKVKLNSHFITGTYNIISPSIMDYTISDMNFEMVYKIKDNKLYWGTDERNLEIFIPK